MSKGTRGRQPRLIPWMTLALKTSLLELKQAPCGCEIRPQPSPRLLKTLILLRDYSRSELDATPQRQPAANLSPFLDTNTALKRISAVVAFAANSSETFPDKYDGIIILELEKTLIISSLFEQFRHLLESGQAGS